jgi:signal transduction histidine kinase
MMSETKSMRSVWNRLIAGLVAVTLFAIAAASLLLYDRFVVTNSAIRDRTLKNDARVIGKLLRRAGEGRPLQLPDFLADNFLHDSGKFAIVTDNGVLVAGSPGVGGPLAAIDPSGNNDFFVSEGGGGHTLYGFTRRATYGDKSVWVQVAFPRGDIVFDSVLEEFLKDIAWIWIPFVVGLLLVNLLVARIGLRPLRVAAGQAESIGKGAISTRIPENNLPIEVHKLVGAVNRGLERLEVAFHSQQRFIADAAHELRTPVAVLKAHVGILPKSDDHVSLKEEIDALDRLVNQLLDAARLDVIKVEPNDTVDLNCVAEAVASRLGPIAIDKGKSIEFVASSAPVIINAPGDFVDCALRNLVENAVRHTALGTTVKIEVARPPSIKVRDHGPGVPYSEKQEIFKRFWQGRRDRGGGAGLGMDIVARTVSALGGTISVEDAPGGGAVFTMTFPDITASPYYPIAS